MQEQRGSDVIEHRCSSMHESCVRRGLLEDDGEWHRAMEEVALPAMPPQLRTFYVSLLTTVHPSEPARLWLAFRDRMSMDFLLAAQRVPTTPPPPPLSHRLAWYHLSTSLTILTNGGAFAVIDVYDAFDLSPGFTCCATVLFMIIYPVLGP